MRISYWSSDVCSSDLGEKLEENNRFIPELDKSVSSSQATTHSKLLHKGWYNAETVAEKLKESVKELSMDLLGSPNQQMSNNNQLRFGKSGKIAVNLTGSKAGTWYDFGSGEGGNLLKLIQRERNLEFKDALQYGVEFAGLAPERIYANLKNLKNHQIDFGKQEKIKKEKKKL